MPRSLTEQAAAARRTERLRAELNRIRAILVTDPGVKRILVFGSMATGQVHEWSDLDLVVVQGTGLPFVERSANLAQLLRPGVGVEFLVYTPEEFREMARRPFVAVEILKKGKFLPMKPAEEAQRWLAFAAEDLRMAELALEHAIYNQACFHAQQCVEKSLKACLVAAGELVPRTRRIADLLTDLPVGARGRLASFEADLLALDQFYVPVRYPDALPGVLPEGLPGEAQARSAVAAAHRCHDQAKRFVGP